MLCPDILQHITDGEKLNKCTLHFDEMAFKCINPWALYQSVALQWNATFILGLISCCQHQTKRMSFNADVSWRTVCDEDKAKEDNCCVLLMNDDEYEHICLLGGWSHVASALDGAGRCEHALNVFVRVWIPNLLQWAVMNSRVRSGTPWTWCEYNEDFHCRSSLASRFSPSPRSYTTQTDADMKVNLRQFFLEINLQMKSSNAALRLGLWPDTVLVGHGDAGVEGVELHDRWDSGVSVYEYLIIQTRNTCDGAGKQGTAVNKYFSQ